MLWHAALGWKAEVAAALEPHGLTPTQFFVLGSTNLLSREDASGARQVDIARLAGLDVMTTSQTVRLLEAGGGGQAHRRPERFAQLAGGDDA